MRFLFVSYVFPGPLSPMASWLAARPENEVIIASSRSRQEHISGNARRVILKKYPAKTAIENPGYFDLWAEAARAGKSAQTSFETVKNTGFLPDMIFISSSNGVALGLQEIFPEAFLVNFLEDENYVKPGQTAMRRGIQCLQTLQANLAFSFSDECRDLYPPELQDKIEIAPVMVDTDFFSPEQAEPFTCLKFSRPPKELVVVFCKNPDDKILDKYWTMCLQLLDMRQKCHIVMLLGNSFALRRMARFRLPANLAARIHLQTQLRNDQLRNLLSAASLTIFPQNEGGICEAMSCGSVPMLAAESAFLKDNVNMLKLKSETPFELAKEVFQALTSRKLSLLADNARESVKKQYGANVIMPVFFPKIMHAWRNLKIC